MDQRLRRGFRIGTFDVEPLSGRIRGPGGLQHVQPKVMDVLVYLAEHSGELVERDTLLEQVWRRITSEEVLTRCISELRRALGEDRGSPRYIQTVPKRGYRLVEPIVLPPAETGRSPNAADGAAAVLAADGAGAVIAADGAAAVTAKNGAAAVTAAAGAPPVIAADGAAAMIAAASPPSPGSAMAAVAVLPFENHSADPAVAFLGDAFAAELHSTLARVDRLRVASRRSSFVFKNASADIREIGKRLNVEYVISGSVQCTGSAVHVVAELNDASTGTQLWAQSYDRKSADLLAIEKDIAGAIVGSFTTHQLRAETDSARHTSTSSLDAWGLVQKARAFALDYTPSGLTEAIEPVRRAIELDSDYAAAHAMLASLLVERLVNGWSTEPKREEAAAFEAAEKASTLAPQDPFILKMTSLVWTYFGAYRRGIGCLRKAVEYAPFDFGAWGYMGWPLTASGDEKDLSDLHGILDRLLSMEPHHPGVAFWRYHESVADICEGHLERARTSAEAALELRPNLSLAWMHYANVLGQSNHKKAAQEASERCAKVNPAMTPKHFASLIKRMTDNESVIDHRLGGLRKIGALRG
jgi:TolB-like protein/DNA-binding winged helix-turn-helix (wHTH) protein